MAGVAGDLVAEARPCQLKAMGERGLESMRPPSRVMGGARPAGRRRIPPRNETASAGKHECRRSLSRSG